MKKLSLATALVLVACSQEVGGPVSPPPVLPEPELPEMVLGIASHSLEHQALSMVEDLKIGHLRTSIYPEHWQSDQKYRIRTMAGIKRAVERGHEVLVVVHLLPHEWEPSDLARFMADRARELPEVEVWQIGNEIPFGKSGTEHARWHTAAYHAVKQANPEALVVTMSVVGNTLHFKEPFLREFLAASPPMDALVAHAYGWPLAPEIEKIADGLRQELQGRELPLWITEFGMNREMIPMWPTLDETHEWEEEQAKEWVTSMESARKAGYARAYGYALQTDEVRETHGIVRLDGSYRPAAVMLRDRPLP